MGFKEIGDKIQQAREDKGLSQQQLARKIGCSQSALSNYEKGKRRLYLSQLELLSQALDKPIDFFMQSRPETEPASNQPVNDSELALIMNDIRMLDGRERQELAEYIRYLNWRRLQKEVPFNDQSGTVQRSKKAGR